MEDFVVNEEKYWLEELLEKENFRLFYQPIVDSVEQKIIAYEILSRCAENSPKPYITPFAILDEKHHQKLDEIALKKAIAVVEQTNTDLLLFVNFHLSNINKLLDLNISQTAKDRIRFEFEFFSPNINKDLLKNNILNLKHANLKYVIDDLGKFPIDNSIIELTDASFLKIDRCITQNIHLYAEKQLLMKEFIILAQNMGSKIITEGVEIKEELLTIEKLGLSLIQGFYFAKPQPILLTDSDIFSIPLKKAS